MRRRSASVMRHRNGHRHHRRSRDAAKCTGRPERDDLRNALGCADARAAVGPRISSVGQLCTGTAPRRYERAMTVAAGCPEDILPAAHDFNRGQGMAPGYGLHTLYKRLGPTADAINLTALIRRYT